MPCANSTADTITLDVRGGVVLTSLIPTPLGCQVPELYKRHTLLGNGTSRSWSARDLALKGFSSPFDESAVDFLMDLDVPALKSLVLK